MGKQLLQRRPMPVWRGEITGKGGKTFGKQTGTSKWCGTDGESPCFEFINIRYPVFQFSFRGKNFLCCL